MDDKLIDRLLKEKQNLEIKIQRLEKRLASLHEQNNQMNMAFHILKNHDARFDSRLSSVSEPKTVGAMAIAVLKEHPLGLLAHDLLEQIQERWMPNLARTSLSPPLSRLKQQGEVSYKNGIWSLNLQKNNQGILSLPPYKGNINQTDKGKTTDKDE